LSYKYNIGNLIRQRKSSYNNTKGALGHSFLSVINNI